MSEKRASQTFSHRYQILHDLGEGGIGRVYKARDEWIGKEIALKVLATYRGSPSLLQEFKNEFSLLAELKHPGVVEVLDFGYSEDPLHHEKTLPYFTMEFVKGKSLREAFVGLFDSHRASAEFEKLYPLVWQICDILEFLHLRGIVHCDLKPDNLKVTESTFRPKVLDFGLSEKMGAKGGKEAKGTLPYMAPEMFKEQPLDQRADLYSLGIILYELVTSRLPFSSDDPVKIVSAHLQQKPVPPSKLNLNLPSSLDVLIMKLLEKSPVDRPDNAIRVKEMIEAALKRDFKTSPKRDFSGEKTLFAHLHSGPLVRRGTELSQLEGLLKEAVGSRGNFLLLWGEQGVGKTFLFKHLKTKCQLQGIIFADSQCLENQTMAYQPLIELLHKLEPYAENGCAGFTLSNLREIFRWSKSHPSDLPEAQAYFHQRLSDLLVEISQSFPFAMVVENLQWADLSTLRFLEHFQKQKDKGKILLCCSSRGVKSKDSAPLDDLTGRCLKEEDAEYLKLDRFDLSGTRELISSKFIKKRFPATFFAYVHQRTSGNPFFIIEVLKYLLEKSIVTLRDSVWTAGVERLEETAVPDSIEAVLLKNLERYDEKTLEFLATVAVAGKRFAPRLARELNQLDEKETSEILSSLTQDQLLIRKEESDGGKTYYEFANQSLRSLLYQRLDRAKRISLHKKLGELLEQIGSEREESVFDMAFHYLLGEEPEKAYKYALLSAEKMQQRFANDEVLRYLENAIDVACRLPHPEEATEKKVAALRKRADFCRTVGELDQAEKDYLAVLKLVGGSRDPKLLAQTHNGLGETYRLKHDYKKAISYLEKAMHIHKELNDPLELAHTLSYLGLAYWTDSQYQNALESFQVALEMDRKLGNEFYVGNTLNNMGLVYWSRHQYSQALTHFTEASSVYRELDNKEWLARSLNNIGATFFELGEYHKCIDHFLESYQLNKEIKNEKEMAFNLENLSEAYRKVGDYSAALQYGEKGLKLASDIGFTARVGCILKDLGTTHFELGEYQEAYRYLKEANQVAGRIGDKELQVLVRIALGKFFTVLNDERNAARLLEEATVIMDAIGDEKSQISVCQMRSRFKKKEGRFEEALELLHQAFALAEKLNVGEEIFSLSLEYAGLYLDKGDVSGSKTFINRARDSGLERYVLLRPAFHLISGRTEWMSGNLKSAQDEFETALRLAEKLDKPEILWQIHHQLAKLFLFTHDVEKAYQHLRRAGSTLKNLDQNIKDDELKRNYLKDSKKEELLSDLKRAAKELIGQTELAQIDSE